MPRVSSMRSLLVFTLVALLALTGTIYSVAFLSVRDLTAALEHISSPLSRRPRPRPRSARLVTDPFERARLANRCWRGYTQHRDRILPRWQAARQLLGLPPAESIAADNGTATYRWNGKACQQSPRRTFHDWCATSFLPTFFSFHAGADVRNARDVTKRFGYVRIWKSGNNAVRFNLQHVYGGERSLTRHRAPLCDERRILQFRAANAMHGDVVEHSTGGAAANGAARNNFTFTFTRHPIERFISAYSELELRIVRMPRYRRGIETGGWQWTHMPRGSTERVHAFVRDLLECRPTGRGAQTVHVYPQVGSVLPHVFDFIGDISRGGTFSRDWHVMWRHMPSPPAASDEGADAHAADWRDSVLTQFNASLGTHVSSQDPYGGAAAARRLLAANPNVVRALCHLYHFDFECLGYEKPAECDVDDDDGG